MKRLLLAASILLAPSAASAWTNSQGVTNDGQPYCAMSVTNAHGSFAMLSRSAAQPHAVLMVSHPAWPAVPAGRNADARLVIDGQRTDARGTTFLVDGRTSVAFPLTGDGALDFVRAFHSGLRLTVTFVSGAPGFDISLAGSAAAMMRMSACIDRFMGSRSPETPSPVSPVSPAGRERRT